MKNWNKSKVYLKDYKDNRKNFDNIKKKLINNKKSS